MWRTCSSHSRAQVTEGRARENEIILWKPCLFLSCIHVSDIFLSEASEIVLAHCSGPKQTPPTISWVWVPWADARRNLKEVVLFRVLEFARMPRQQYVCPCEIPAIQTLSSLRSHLVICLTARSSVKSLGGHPLTRSPPSARSSCQALVPSNQSSRAFISPTNSRGGQDRGGVVTAAGKSDICQEGSRWIGFVCSGNWIMNQNRKPKKSGWGPRPGQRWPWPAHIRRRRSLRKQGKAISGKEKAKRMSVDKTGRTSSNMYIYIFHFGEFFGAQRQSPIFSVYCVRLWQECAELQFSDNDYILNRERR